MVDVDNDIDGDNRTLKKFRSLSFAEESELLQADL